MKKLLIMFSMVLLLTGIVTAQEYNIAFSTTPEQVTARDNPFGHYDDPLPSFKVIVTNSNNQPAEDVNIKATIKHVDNLVLPSGFPWVEGTEMISVENVEDDGVLEVDAFLFPLRGDYTVDIEVTDASAKKQTAQFTMGAKEPFKQSTMNAIIFLLGLGIFGFIVGWIFGKDVKRSKKGQAKLAFSILVIVGLALTPFIMAHGDEEIEESGVIHYEDENLVFFTTPEVPDIGTVTTFTLAATDAEGKPLDNAKAYFEFANEEEGFVVLELELFAKDGIFTFNYGIFDGAPHMAKVRVEPTEASSTQFEVLEREYAFAAEAHNPPASAKFIAILVMLAAMVIGLVLGIAARRMKKGDHDE